MILLIYEIRVGVAGRLGHGDEWLWIWVADMVGAAGYSGFDTAGRSAVESGQERPEMVVCGFASGQFSGGIAGDLFAYAP